MIPTASKLTPTPPAIEVQAGQQWFRFRTSSRWRITSISMPLGLAYIDSVSSVAKDWEPLTEFCDPFQWQLVSHAQEPPIKPVCECGADKCKTSHSRWCPKYEQTG